VKPFTGHLPSVFEKVHLPHFLMWLPPLLLSIGGILLGSFPGIIDKSLIQPIVLSIHGTAVDISLKIWHGFNLVLLLSGITLLFGGLLFWLRKPSHQSLDTINRFESFSPARLFHYSAHLFESIARWYTSRMKNGYLRMYMITILVFTIILLAYRLFHECAYLP
jgi:multicomponent Na+:H+ antiporter subunit A